MDAPGCRAFADILASSTRQSYKQSADNVDRGYPSHGLMKGSRHGGLMGILVGLSFRNRPYKSSRVADDKRFLRSFINHFVTWANIDVGFTLFLW